VFFFITLTALGAFSLGFHAGYFGARNVFLGQELDYWTHSMALKAAAFANSTISGDIQGSEEIRDLIRRRGAASGDAGRSPR
jgi:hypothetical protein